MNRHSTALIVILLAVHSIVAPLMAFTVGFSGSLSSTPSDGVTDIDGSVTLTVSVQTVQILGLPDGEAPDENSLQIDYRWLTGKYSEEDEPTMTVQKEGGTTFTVSDGSKGIDGPGNYAVRCEIKARITIGGEPSESEWTSVGTRDARFVAVGLLLCSGVATPVSSFMDTATVILPVGYNGGSVTVIATPLPTGAWPTGKPTWSGDVLSSSGATATVNTSTPGVKTVTATCGNSVTIRICVASLDIRADVNHDGSITDADNAVVNGAELEETTPGLILTLPSEKDVSNEDKARRFAEVRLVTQGFTGLPANAVPSMFLDYDEDFVEVFDAVVGGNKIPPGSPIPASASTIPVYAKGVAATSIADGIKYIGDKNVYDESNSDNPSKFLKNGNILSFGYSHDSVGLNDTYEIFAYAARARAKPLGTLPEVSGFVTIDLKGFGYNHRHYSHSRQFRSNIIDEALYWGFIKEKCEK